MLTVLFIREMTSDLPDNGGCFSGKYKTAVQVHIWKVLGLEKQSRDKGWCHRVKAITP